MTYICARRAAAAAVLAVSGAGDVCGGGGAGAGGSSAPVLRLSQNFHPLIQKNLFFKPILGIHRVLGTHFSAGSYTTFLPLRG